MNTSTSPSWGNCRNCDLSCETNVLACSGIDGVYCSQRCLDEIKAGKVPRQHRPDSVGALKAGSR